MRISIVGAGPAGLYLAILLKKADPAHEITVTERNAPDATFGWGVVFSEETLGALRDADYPTYLEITDSFARWTSIDIHYRGRCCARPGHTFSAIKRTHLLEILQRRARAAGASLRGSASRCLRLRSPRTWWWRRTGSNSTLRQRLASAAPRYPQGCKYVWFGTDLVLDAFTFIFNDTEHGSVPGARVPLRRAHEHVHRGDGRADVAARRAGRDVRGGQHRVLPVAVRRAELGGTGSCRTSRPGWTSRWCATRTGTTATWCWSATRRTPRTSRSARARSSRWRTRSRWPTASSGTRPAWSRALTDYELERQPVVERFQQAAGDSAAYFGRVATTAVLRADPVRGQPADAQRADQPREPHAAGPAVRAGAGRVVRRHRRPRTRPSSRARWRRRRCSHRYGSVRRPCATGSCVQRRTSRTRREQEPGWC